METKLFYRDDLWNKIVECKNYELGGRELKALQRVVPLAVRQAPTPANIIHLGVGDGREIQEIVGRMAVKKYLLNDINCHSLRRTAKRARTNFSNVEFHEVCIDIETSGNISILRDGLTGPTIIVLVGNAVIFSNRSLDKEICQAMREDDYFLFTGESPHPDMFSSYRAQPVLDLLKTTLDKTKYRYDEHDQCMKMERDGEILLASYKPTLAQLRERMLSANFAEVVVREYKDLHMLAALFKKR